MGDDDLIERMRTCAAHLSREEGKNLGRLEASYQAAMIDACKLLHEGADHIEREHRDRMMQLQKQIEAQQKPMELIPPMPPILPKPPQVTPGVTFEAQWVGPGDQIAARHVSRTCPQCGSHAHKKVFRREGGFDLECPVCVHRWPL